MSGRNIKLGKLQYKTKIFSRTATLKKKTPLVAAGPWPAFCTGVARKKNCEIKVFFVKNTKTLPGSTFFPVSLSTSLSPWLHAMKALEEKNSFLSKYLRQAPPLVNLSDWRFSPTWIILSKFHQAGVFLAPHSTSAAKEISRIASIQ